jgi:hypothetical protein
MKTAILFLLSTIVSPYAQARTGLDELFENHFYDAYDPAYCASNIRLFLDAADRRSFPISEFLAIYIRNRRPVPDEIPREDRHLYRVAAVLARTEDLPGPIPAPPGYAEWGYHVILADGDRDSSVVYDFDFTNAPYPIRMGNYWQKMFLRDRDGRPLSEAERARKLDDYVLQICPGDVYLFEPFARRKLICDERPLGEWAEIFGWSI